MMSVSCGEWRWPKSVVNGLAGMEVRGAGKVREMEARVLFLVANQDLGNIKQKLTEISDAQTVASELGLDEIRVIRIIYAEDLLSSPVRLPRR